MYLLYECLLWCIVCVCVCGVMLPTEKYPSCEFFLFDTYPLNFFQTFQPFHPRNDIFK